MYERTRGSSDHSCSFVVRVFALCTHEIICNLYHTMTSSLRELALLATRVPFASIQRPLRLGHQSRPRRRIIDDVAPSSSWLIIAGVYCKQSSGGFQRFLGMIQEPNEGWVSKSLAVAYRLR